MIIRTASLATVQSPTANPVVLTADAAVKIDSPTDASCSPSEISTEPATKRPT